jgi:hypothetical protein
MNTEIAEIMANDKGEADFFAAERGENEPFRVDCDRKADWALTRIKAARDEHRRLTSVIRQEIGELNAMLADEDRKLENATAWLAAQLRAYMEAVGPESVKKAKTQASYRLPHGTLKIKYGGEGWSYDEQKLAGWLAGGGYGEFVETVQKLKWGAFKKTLQRAGDGKLLTEAGEEIPADLLKTERKPDTFEAETT